MTNNKPDNLALSAQTGRHIAEFCNFLESMHVSGEADSELDEAFGCLRTASAMLKTGVSQVTGIDRIPQIEALACGVATAATLAKMLGSNADEAHGNMPTLRDRFAMAAMQGILSDSESFYQTFGALAGDCYAIADAMLKERGK